MELNFHKLDGAGNDFVGLDWRDRDPLPPEAMSALVRVLCDRHHGVGADGVLVVERPRTGERADFAMRYFNADGSAGEMCGNGARCIAVLAHDLGAAGPEMQFQTDAGVYRAELVEGGARVFFPPIIGLPEQQTLSGPLHSGETCLFLIAGVPHAVLFTEEVDMIDVAQAGHEIRHDPAFAPRGTNVNFVEIGKDGVLKVRTYERGVEAETLACGTGSVASVCCHLHRLASRTAQEVEVVPTGGIPLRISVLPTAGGFEQIALAGPARLVYRGETRLEALSGHLFAV